jgi:hypothetical protein
MARHEKKAALVILAMLSSGLAPVAVRAEPPAVGSSPWGPTDEIGRLNLMTAASRAAILARVRGGAVYDLSVEYFVGMPSWQAAGTRRTRCG